MTSDSPASTRSFRWGAEDRKQQIYSNITTIGTDTDGSPDLPPHYSTLYPNSNSLILVPLSASAFTVPACEPHSLPPPPSYQQAVSSSSPSSSSSSFEALITRSPDRVTPTSNSTPKRSTAAIAPAPLTSIVPAAPPSASPIEQSARTFTATKSSICPRVTLFDVMWYAHMIFPFIYFALEILVAAFSSYGLVVLYCILVGLICPLGCYIVIRLFVPHLFTTVQQQNRCLALTILLAILCIACGLPFGHGLHGVFLSEKPESCTNCRLYSIASFRASHYDRFDFESGSIRLVDTYAIQPAVQNEDGSWTIGYVSPLVDSSIPFAGNATTYPIWLCTVDSTFDGPQFELTSTNTPTLKRVTTVDLIYSACEEMIEAAEVQHHLKSADPFFFVTVEDWDDDRAYYKAMSIAVGIIAALASVAWILANRQLNKPLLNNQ